MKTALVCDKWKLNIQPGMAAPVAGEEKRVLGYYEYINGKMHEVGRNAYCIEYLLSQLPRHGVVAELFGGVGVFATVVQNVLEPKFHAVFDLDPDCYSQLCQAFFGRSDVEVEQGDARDFMGSFPADLFLLDFPFFTVKQYSFWEEQWKNMIAQQPKAIVWMDGASKYLHLHTETYSQITGCEVTSDHSSYIRAVSEFIFQRHGYSVQACAFSTGCYYFLACPGRNEGPIKIVRETRQGGLRWVSAVGPN